MLVIDLMSMRGGSTRFGWGRKGVRMSLGSRYGVLHVVRKGADEKFDEQSCGHGAYLCAYRKLSLTALELTTCLATWALHAWCTEVYTIQVLTYRLS